MMKDRMGSPWSDLEDGLLIWCWNRKFSIRQIASLFGRTPGAVKSRLGSNQMGKRRFKKKIMPMRHYDCYQSLSEGDYKVPRDIIVLGSEALEDGCDTPIQLLDLSAGSYNVDDLLDDDIKVCELINVALLYPDRFVFSDDKTFCVLSLDSNFMNSFPYQDVAEEPKPTKLVIEIPEGVRITALQVLNGKVELEYI